MKKRPLCFGEYAGGSPACTSPNCSWIPDCAAETELRRLGADGKLKALLAHHPCAKPPEYALGQRVKVCGWVGHDFGTIVDINRVFHNRVGEYTWGYRCRYEGDGPGLSLLYVPEGYLRELPPPPPDPGDLAFVSSG